MNLGDFIESLYHDPPEMLEASEVARVTPNAWDLADWERKGRSDQNAARLRYWRQPGESAWHRVEWCPEFDIGSHDLLR